MQVEETKLNIRIGIIGPVDSVEKILLVTENFKHITFIPFIYEDVYQVDELIQNNVTPIDQWLFSGVLNFTYAMKKKLVGEDNATYPPLYGSSFFGTLLKAQLAENKVIKKISMDTFSDVEVEKVLAFNQLQAIEYLNFPFSDYTYIHDLTDFHEKAYQEGRAEVAITSTNYAYMQLKEKNVPVYRMKPSYLAIQLSIEMLIERAQANRFKLSQIAMIGASIDFHIQENDHVYFTYKMKQEELDIKKELLLLAEEVSGSFISVGLGSYLIYTSRGEINREALQFMFQLSNKIHATQQLKLQFAIGYGETTSQAEQHVNLGLKQVQQDSTIVIVDEDQEITIKQEDHDKDGLRYATVSIGKDWENKIKESGISSSLLSKIISLANHYHRTEFTSQDLARWLKSSDRNARRILLQLERAGLIEQYGEVSSGGRGRPRKIYRFIDMNL